MEKKNFLVPSITGFAGLVIGALIIVAFHTSIWQLQINKPCSNSVSLTDATNFIKGLDASAQTYSDKLKGFNIDIQQYYAMQCLYNHNQLLGGFRIYFGTDASGSTSSMVVGMDGSGLDDKSLFYSVNNVNPKTSGPCPPACDSY